MAIMMDIFMSLFFGDDNGANNVKDYDLFYDMALIMMIHLATMFHDIINKKVHNRQVQIRG